MKIQELRIGNWFIDYSGKPSQWSLEHFELLTLEKNRPDIDEMIKSPIQLTEEILLKCGFQPKYFGIKTYYSPLMELDHDFYLMGVDYGVKIKHLHQLQNLYFALTGEELEVKL